VRVVPLARDVSTETIGAPKPTLQYATSEQLQAAAHSAQENSAAAMRVANTARTTANAAKSDADQLKVDRDEYLAALQASVVDRRSLHDADAATNARIDTIQLTPGPPGKDGANGAAGKDGAPADMARVAALEAKMPAFGYQATTALALLQTKDYVVALNKAMPSTSYTAKTFVEPAFAGKLGATVVAQSATSVTVRTTGLLAVGAGGFAVICWA